MHFDAAYAAPSSKHDRHLPSQLRGQPSPQTACSDVPPTSSKKQLPKLRGVCVFRGSPENQTAPRRSCGARGARGDRLGQARGVPQGAGFLPEAGLLKTYSRIQKCKRPVLAFVAKKQCFSLVCKLIFGDQDSSESASRDLQNSRICK